MASGWSIAGKRVEVKAGFPAGKLVLDGETATKLKAKGSFPLQVGIYLIAAVAFVAAAGALQVAAGP